MKLIFILIISALCLFSGCANNTHKSTDSPAETNDTSSQNQADTTTVTPVRTDTTTATDIFSIQAKGHSFYLQQWIRGSELAAIIGEPLKQQTDTLKNADTFTGSVVNTFTWNGLVIKTFMPKGKTEPGWIMEVTVSSPAYKTSKGIGLNNEVAQLKQVYPSVRIAEDGRSKENNGLYIINDNGDTKNLEFTVKNGTIRKIRLYYMLP